VINKQVVCDGAFAEKMLQNYDEY